MRDNISNIPTPSPTGESCSIFGPFVPSPSSSGGARRMVGAKSSCDKAPLGASTYASMLDATGDTVPLHTDVAVETTLLFRFSDWPLLTVHILFPASIPPPICCTCASDARCVKGGIDELCALACVACGDTVLDIA